MAEENDFQEKTEEPSQYRIDEFRKKGEVASSKEINSILILSGCILALIFSVVLIFDTINNYVMYLYRLDIEKAYTSIGVKTLILETLSTILKCVAPVFVTSVTLGIVCQVMQIGFLYSPEVIKMKLERINPVNGFKKLFSMKSLVEALKGILKFTLILSITYGVMKKDLPSFNGFLQTDFVSAFVVGKGLVIKLVFSIVLGLILVALIDLSWEKYSYRKKLMMSKQELKDETKEKDGNPEVKQRIRAIQREIATKRMMAEVPDSDVIVTNPTHISVALKYDPKTMVSPLVVAKGPDHLALMIRKIAKKNNIPIVENIVLARALYKKVEIGDSVPRDLYKAVAGILAFVYKMKRKEKSLSMS